MKVGDKVICVDSSNQVNHSIKRILGRVVLNEIYTIKSFNAIDGVCLKEFVHGYHFDGEEAGFNPRRFRPIDYSVGEKVAEYIATECEKLIKPELV